jgi:hypothetical protein
MSYVIQPLNYVRKRAELEPKLTAIDIYSGHIFPNTPAQNRMKVQEIRFVDPGKLDATFDHFEKNTFGDFTAFFRPSKTFIHFSNGNVAGLKVEETQNFNGPQSSPYMNIPTTEQIRAQVEREMELERLKHKLQMLEDEQESRDNVSEKFNSILGVVIEKFLNPNKNIMPDVANLNGVNPDDLSDTEQSLAYIVSAFGEDWINRFAQRVKSDPGVVKQIKSFFP